MGFIRDGTILAVLQALLLFHSCYGAPASGINPSQASILSQQAYNLCLYKSSLGSEREPCTSFGVSGLPPITTVVSSQEATATFIASFLTEYADLTSPIIIETVVDGTSTQAFVGELGQIWANLGDVRIPHPTKVPEVPITNDKELKRAVAKAMKKTTAVQQPTTKASTPKTTAQAPPQTTTQTRPTATTSKASSSTTSTSSSAIVVLPSSTSTSSFSVVTSSTSKSLLISSQTSSISSVVSISSASNTKPSPIVSSIKTSASSTGSITGSSTGSIIGSTGSLTKSASSNLSGSPSSSTCIASTYISAGSTYTAKCTGVPISSSSTCTPSVYVTSGTTMTAYCKPTSSVCTASTYVTSGSTITAGCTTISACTASTKVISGKTTVASCTQASIKIASWTTNKANQAGITATAFNPAKASSVASGIDALISQWNDMGDNSTETSGKASFFGSVPKTTPVSLTTFATSKVPLSTGAAIKRRGLYL